MELNKYFFEALRLRLENILRALSNNRKAHIVYSTSIATDVKNTVYLQARDFIEPNVKPALAELLLFYKACVSHEGAHIRFTSLDDWKEACNRGPAFQHLTNIIEDGRIETAISQTLPGTGRWIKFTNQYIYNHRKPETYGAGLKAFLMGLNIYSILQIIPPFLSPETQRLIKLAAPYVDIGRAATTTKEVLGCVEEILAIPEIKSLVDASTPPPMIEGDKGTTSPEKTTPSEETSERAEKAKKIIQRRKSRDKNSNENKSNQKKYLDETKKESDNNEDSGNTDSQDNEFSEDDSDTEDTGDTPDNVPEQTLENPDEDSEEVSDSQDTERQESGLQKQENDETLSDIDETASNNEETSESPDEAIEDEDTPVSEETLENPDEDNDRESSEQSLDSEESDDDLSEASENEELDDSDNDFDDDASGNVSEEEFDQSDDDFDSEDFEVELDSSVESYESSENAENNETEFENGTPESLDSESYGNPSNSGDDEEEFFTNPPEEDFGELLEDTNEEALTLTKEAENIEEEETPLDILKGIPVNIHGGIELVPQNLRRNPSAYQALKKKNEVLIKNLVNEIQVALETRKAYDLRSLNRGRLHSGSLWKLAVPDPTVFSRRVIPGDIPELAVYILVDLSGSMSEQNTYPGPTRIQSVKNATCVLSEGMRELKIAHAVTGFQASYPQAFHYPVVTWDSMDSVKIASFRSGCSNRDGYSIRVAANELSYRQEPKKILFVLSDGQPADYEGYTNNLAWNDVKQAVFETKNKGIKVISLFFGDEYLVPTFKFMYDTPVFVHDLTILPRVLGDVFKKVYLE
ncbi:MAG TPA: hypothetical protein DEB05_02885 [Firmicutes bacterium]|jgi:hypothetical protein|nr:hypothetical protein [Bacillota bacterium]